MNTPSYDQKIHGLPTTSPEEIKARLIAEKCVWNGKIMVFPEWLTPANLFSLRDSGLVKTKTYKSCYGHTDYFIQ